MDDLVISRIHNLNEDFSLLIEFEEMRYCQFILDRGVIRNALFNGFKSFREIREKVRVGS